MYNRYLEVSRRQQFLSNLKFNLNNKKIISESLYSSLLAFYLIDQFVKFYDDLLLNWIERLFCQSQLWRMIAADY